MRYLFSWPPEQQTGNCISRAVQYPNHKEVHNYYIISLESKSIAADVLDHLIK